MSKKIQFFASLSLFLFFFIFAGKTFAQNYKLVWSDEFDSTSLDMSKWSFDTGGSGFGNNELEYYTNRSSNLHIENGNLVIQALKENYSGKSYTSARIKTQGKYSVAYGKIEARMKLPYGNGMWPAFWMLGDNINSVSWPACGETDIMEMVGGSGTNGTTNLSDATVYGTVHWSNNGQHAQFGNHYSLSSGKFADSFHTFSIVWTPQQISWYCDDHKYLSISITPSGLSAFHNKFFIILNLAVGGNWPGSPNSSTVFPQTMLVDYVRVYKDVSQLPTVGLTSPQNNSKFDANSNITLSADAGTETGTITNVEFFQGNIPIGQTDVTPFQLNWKNVLPGNYKIKAVATNSGGFSETSNYINLTVGNGAAESPAGGSPIEIPGTIEAENFDIGGQNVSYYDSDNSNNGGEYRPDDYVDIEKCSDTGEGYDVGWTVANEWLKYTVNVQSSGTYQVEARVASANSGGSFKVEVDGNDITGNISVPNSGGWQTWQSVTSKNFQLSAGIHTIRIFIVSGNFNLNKIYILPPNTGTSIKVLSPNGEEMWSPGSIHEITWQSFKSNSVQIGFTSDGGKFWSYISKETPAIFGSVRWKVPAIASSDCKIMVLDTDNKTINDVSDSSFTIVNVDAVNLNTKISGYVLNQNYPNPFNPSTIISYSLPSRKYVTLKVFDQMGNEVATLVNSEQVAGNHSVQFDASNTSENKKLASGIYFYKLKAGNFMQVKKLMLLK